MVSVSSIVSVDAAVSAVVWAKAPRPRNGIIANNRTNFVWIPMCSPRSRTTNVDLQELSEGLQKTIGQMTNYYLLLNIINWLHFTLAHQMVRILPLWGWIDSLDIAAFKPARTTMVESSLKKFLFFELRK